MRTACGAWRWKAEPGYRTHILTIDGAGKCTRQPAVFGSIHIRIASNIIIRDITFLNFNTYEGVYAPEEPACIYATNISKRKPCRACLRTWPSKGRAPASPNSNYRTRYGITVKGYGGMCVSIISVCRRSLSSRFPLQTRIPSIYQR